MKMGGIVEPIFQTHSIAGYGWHVLECKHLSGAENNGGRAVYVDVVDEKNRDLRQTGLHVRYGWEGMQPDEAPPLVPLDKAPGDGAAGNFVLFPGMKAWAEIVGADSPSDRVVGFTVDLPSDGQGNEFGLHSYYVKFGLR